MVVAVIMTKKLTDIKRITMLFHTFCALNCAFGQLQEGGTPESFNFVNKTTESLPTFSFSFNESQIKAINDTAYDVGVAELVNINFITQSYKFITDDGVKVYRLLIEVKNALGLGVEFSDFYLPVGSKLYAYNVDKTIILGAYTSNNNQSDNKFSIQPISGTKLILEYNEPMNVNDNPRIIINRISKIYRPLFGDNHNAQQRSSDCYENVHCVTGIEVERSVMKWFYYDEKDESYYVCSCVLVNQDVSADEVKPYVLTANHCGKNADLSTAVFYFNYQNSTCTSNNANQYNYTLTGCTKRAKRAVIDMFLLELYSFPPPDYNVHWAGWDRSNRNNLSDDVMGIHHPNGTNKKISLGTFKANSNPNFWRVEWNRNNAPTARGSSGSPLFEDDNDRIIGWLSYGTSDCENINGIDRYGKFREAWSSIYGSDQRLKDWLDPNDNNKNELDGRDPCFTNLVIQNRTFYSAQHRYQPENKVTVQAGNTIETSGSVIIKSGSEYKFTAGQQIILKPGFHAEAGSNFTATIEPCKLVANKISSKNETTIDSLIEEKTIVYKHKTEILDLELQTSVFAFPNPSRIFTTIEYSLANEDFVSIEIYDINGILITTLMDKKQHKKGIYQIYFDTSNLSSGLYNCVFKTSSTVKKCRIIKTN